MPTSVFVLTCIDFNKVYSISLQDRNLRLQEIDLHKETKLQVKGQDLNLGLFVCQVRSSFTSLIIDHKHNFLISMSFPCLEMLNYFITLEYKISLLVVV